MQERSPADVVRLVKDQNVEIVDFRFCDLPGLMQHFSVPAAELTEGLFEDGIGFDGSSIRGFQEIQESDMLLVPDPDTAYMDPFTQHRTLNINCYVKDPVTGSRTKQLMFNVLCCRKGSRTAVLGSGMRIMSDSWISWKPRIDEPSKPSPSSNASALNSCAGAEKCCISPGKSQKRKSTISASLSFNMPRTSFGVATDPSPSSLDDVLEA